MLDFLGLEPMPLPAPDLRLNAGEGEAGGVPVEVRARLRDRLAPTYDAMRNRFGLEWPGSDARHSRDA